MPFARAVLGIAWLTLASSCSAGSSSPTAGGTPDPSATGIPGPAPAGERVLFVGNSLTEANDLPLMVEALSQAGGRPLSCDKVTYGGVSLEDHWGLKTQDRIAAGGWRYVVLQQGPSALPESRVNLREWTARFDTVIRQSGARTALYMVWPESFRREAFPDVSASYRLAAEDVGGLILPAGDAWLAAWRRKPSLALYGGDGFHPSTTGSYLAALTIYAGLTGGSPTGLPVRFRLRNGVNVEISLSDGPVLQAAAEEAVARQYVRNHET
jgi:hypothetical protein